MDIQLGTTNFNGHRQWIAVLGGAARYSREQIIAAFKTGQEIARQGRNLLTGGTTGIPYAAAIGAKSAGALVVGVSPAASLEEHVEKYGKPLDYADLIIYTGVGYAGRSPIIVQSVCGAIFIGGEIGTLYEFGAAWMTGENVLGVLQGSGGITDQFQSILSQIQTNWGSHLVYDQDPVRLVQKVCADSGEIYSSRMSQLTCEGVGGDVCRMIDEYLSEENPGPCTARPGSTQIGASSTISQP
jgi:uncharacterized protein (TIGR00725 family)